MSEKKLPEYVEDEIDDLQDLSETYGYAQAEHDEDPVNVRAPDNIPREEMAKDLYAAILRYGQEREAAALEKAATACEEVDASRRHDSMDDCELCAKAIRAMIPKESPK